MNWTVAFAGATATNVGQRDAIPPIAGICRRAPTPHNDQEDEALVALLPKIGKFHALCNSVAEDRREGSWKRNGYFGIKERKKDQSA